MNQTFKATKAQVWPLVKAAFPGYKGRTFSVEFVASVTLHDLDFHDSGSKNEYVAVAVDGKSVIVTRDTADGLFVNVNTYTYRSEDGADLAAYRMARLQANA